VISGGLLKNACSPAVKAGCGVEFRNSLIYIMSIYILIIKHGFILSPCVLEVSAAMGDRSRGIFSLRRTGRRRKDRNQEVSKRSRLAGVARVENNKSKALPTQRPKWPLQQRRP
jgi:hypothetical protein